MEAVFRYLESLARSEYLIVETGCIRQDDWIDGRSTVLFDQFFLKCEADLPLATRSLGAAVRENAKRWARHSNRAQIS